MHKPPFGSEPNLVRDQVAMRRMDLTNITWPCG